MFQSFVAHSRDALICRDFRVVIWPADLDDIDMIEMAAFPHTL